MHKRFIILILFLSIVLFGARAQCSQYQIQIVESVSAFYETSNSMFEAQVELNKILDDFKAGDTELNYDNLNTNVKLVKDNLGIAESVLEVALSNAEMCYCLNGQIQSDELLVMIDEINEKNKTSLKLLKSLKKTTGRDEIEKIFIEIEQLLYDSYQICEKASEKAIDAQDICY